MIGVLSRMGFAGRAVVFRRDNVSAPARIFCESLDDNDQTIAVSYSADGVSYTPGTPITLKAFGKADAALPVAGNFVKYECQGEVLLSVVCAYDQLVDHVYGVNA
jgi:hypothetical protein